ncbi:hypothetical protein [Acetobacter orientalis]|uniref:hypothetical protein n=1 Tax=Acetobacter orientalis TaxID=146474 RepID=UPI001177B3C3|nr:hypothetical protein [Acetobacter orientalis]
MIDIRRDGNCPEVLNAGLIWLCKNSNNQDAYIFSPAKSIAVDFSISSFMSGVGQDILKQLLRTQPVIVSGARLHLFYENKSRIGGNPPVQSSFTGNILLLAGCLENTRRVMSDYPRASFCLAPAIKAEALEWRQQLQATIVETI